MATGKEISATTLEAYSCEGGYIWGQQGAEWTKAKQAALEKKYNSDPEQYASYKGSATYGKKWIGHRVWDCAGLCRWAAKEHGIAIHSGSNLIWNCDLKEKGALTEGQVLPEGALVFTGTKDSKPHVGTYTGDGMVTEASGAKTGVIQSNLHGGKWKWYGLVKGVEYDSPAPAPDPDPDPQPEPTPAPEGYAIVIGKNLALRQGPSTDCAVICRAPTGSTVKITAPPDDWEHVEYNGKSGYMMKKYLEEG